jgi:hypothetical protein
MVTTRRLASASSRMSGYGRRSERSTPISFMSAITSVYWPIEGATILMQVQVLSGDQTVARSP